MIIALDAFSNKPISKFANNVFLTVAYLAKVRPWQSLVVRPLQ